MWSWISKLEWLGRCGSPTSRHQHRHYHQHHHLSETGMKTLLKVYRKRKSTMREEFFSHTGISFFMGKLSLNGALHCLDHGWQILSATLKLNSWHVATSMFPSNWVIAIHLFVFGNMTLRWHNFRRLQFHWKTLQRGHGLWLLCIPCEYTNFGPASLFKLRMFLGTVAVNGTVLTSLSNFLALGLFRQIWFWTIVRGRLIWTDLVVVKLEHVTFFVITLCIWNLPEGHGWRTDGNSTFLGNGYKLPEGASLSALDGALFGSHTVLRWLCSIPSPDGGYQKLEPNSPCLTLLSSSSFLFLQYRCLRLLCISFGSKDTVGEKFPFFWWKDEFYWYCNGADPTLKDR